MLQYIIIIEYIKNTLAPNMRAEAYKESMTEEGDALDSSNMKMAEDAHARIYPDKPTGGLTTEEETDFDYLDKKYGTPGG